MKWTHPLSLRLWGVTVLFIFLPLLIFGVYWNLPSGQTEILYQNQGRILSQTIHYNPRLITVTATFPDGRMATTVLNEGADPFKPGEVTLDKSSPTTIWIKEGNYGRRIPFYLQKIEADEIRSTRHPWIAGLMPGCLILILTSIALSCLTGRRNPEKIIPLDRYPYPQY